MTTEPQVHFNNYIKIKQTSLDVLSKFFIIFGCLLGINRLTVCGIRKLILKIASVFYSISVISFVGYITVIANGQDFTGWVKLIQYAVYAFFGFATRKKLQKFYKELQNFDKQFGFTPKITPGTLKILPQLAFITVFSGSIIKREDLIFSVVTNLVHILENQYYGHLLNVLIQRLRSINLSIKSSLSNTEIEKSTVAKKFSINITGNEIQITKLMDFYYIIVNAYDLLIDAIKYQVKIIEWFPFDVLIPDTLN